MTAPAHQPKTTIRQLRQARTWTQADLADRLGVHPWTVAAWERGQVAPQPRHQTRLSLLFGVPLNAIAFSEREQR